jgi:hypothetical protein
MSATEVRPKGGPGPTAPAPLVDCTPLFSLAAGAADARVRRAPGAVGGGDLRAAGGSCAPTAGVAPLRPQHAHGSARLSPRRPGDHPDLVRSSSASTGTGRGLPAHGNRTTPAPDAGPKEEK